MKIAKEQEGGSNKGKATDNSVSLVIQAPTFHTASFKIRGTAPYVQNRFSQKAREQMIATQKAGSQAKTKKNREAKDFDLCFQQAQHISDEGWCGIPASAFRAGMISACRLVGFTMTKAKMSVFVLADGLDQADGTGLVRITKGKPEMVIHHVRNDSGVVDVRPRPMWKHWEATVRVQWDLGQFALQDVTNLLMRVGMQVGVGEGRPDSKDSIGMGWGTFELCDS